jgi:hypothetical protein
VQRRFIIIGKFIIIRGRTRKETANPNLSPEKKRK